MLVGQSGPQHGRIGLVPLVRFLEVLDLDGKVASVLARIEQGIEDRVAVKARQAAPHNAAAPVDQRGDRAVADHAQR